MRFFLSLIVLLALAAAALAGGAFYEDRLFAAAGPAGEEKTVIVKPGSGVAAIAQTLAGAGVVDSALMFRIGVVRRGRTAQLKAGSMPSPRM